MAEIAPRPYGPAPAWSQRDAERNPAGYVRALVDEAHRFTGDDLVQKPWYQRWYENPGFLSSVPKTEREMLDDARQAYVLENLTKNVPATQLHKLDELMSGDNGMSDEQVGNLTRAYALYPVNAKGLSSDYRTTSRPETLAQQIAAPLVGVTTPGSGGYAALEWMDSVPAIFAGASQYAADAADKYVSERKGIPPNSRYPNALSDMISAGQNVANPLGYEIPVLDESDVSAGTKRQRALDSYDAFMPEDSWLMHSLLGGQDMGQQRSQMAAHASRLPDQEQTLIESGVPASAAAIGGALHQIVFDPFSSAGTAVRTARKGDAALALRQLAEEGTVHGAFLTNSGIQGLGDIDADGMPRYYTPQR